MDHVVCVNHNEDWDGASDVRETQMQYDLVVLVVKKHSSDPESTHVVVSISLDVDHW